MRAHRTAAIAVSLCAACTGVVGDGDQGGELEVERLAAGDSEHAWRVSDGSDSRTVRGALLRDYGYVRVESADGRELVTVHQASGEVLVWDGQAAFRVDSPSWSARLDPLTRRALQPEVLGRLDLDGAALADVLRPKNAIDPESAQPALDEQSRRGVGASAARDSATPTEIDITSLFCRSRCLDSLCAACMRKLCAYAKCVDDPACSREEAERKAADARCYCGGDCFGAVGTFN